MFEVFEGSATVQGKTGVGGAVVSGEHVIFYHGFFKASDVGGAVGGLAGLLIGKAADKVASKIREKKDHEPGLADDPDLVGLPEELKEKLAGVQNYEKLNRSDFSKIEKTFLGYKFRTGDGRTYKLNSQKNKKKIRTFLQQNGYSIAIT